MSKKKDSEYRASEHYNSALKLRVFHAFLSHYVKSFENKSYKSGNEYDLVHQFDPIIHKFRFYSIVPPVFSALKKFANLKKIEKQNEAKRDAMWNKINS